jgi:hypothetical protein
LTKYIPCHSPCDSYESMLRTTLMVTRLLHNSNRYAYSLNLHFEMYLYCVHTVLYTLWKSILSKHFEGCLRF